LRGFKRVALWVASWLARITLVLGLPFWLLVRGSLLAHSTFAASAWLALSVGAMAAALCVATVAWWIWRRLTGRDRFRAIGIRIVLPTVVGFCAYLLLYVSPPNVKTPEVRCFYTQIHPILRVGLGALIVFDPEIVITDIARDPDDYAAMGLPARQRSLHYEQEDGWVHAVDLRTQRRGRVRNGLVRLYFFVMGFDSLRHSLRQGGNGDHLHVSLAAA
jgi:hypothetical protein